MYHTPLWYKFKVLVRECPQIKSKGAILPESALMQSISSADLKF